jgi:hypothetical protein
MDDFDMLSCTDFPLPGDTKADCSPPLISGPTAATKRGQGLIAITSFGNDNSPLLPASLTEDVHFPHPALSGEVKEFLREHNLQSDFHRFYDLLESVFGAMTAVSFQVAYDPEIETMSCIEALVTIPQEAEVVAELYRQFIDRFDQVVAHENQLFFCLSFQPE